MYIFTYFLHCSTSWKKQPYTRGSYTAIAVGASQDDIELLAQPLYASEQEQKVKQSFSCFKTVRTFLFLVACAVVCGRTHAQQLLLHSSWRVSDGKDGRSGSPHLWGPSGSCTELWRYNWPKFVDSGDLSRIALCLYAYKTHVKNLLLLQTTASHKCRYFCLVVVENWVHVKLLFYELVI